MTDAWTTSLPESLQKNPVDLSRLKMCVTQWSRLVSWSWTSILAFHDDQGKAEQEQMLKTVFNKTLQQQGQNTYAYESYADLESQGKADNLSSTLMSLFLGDYSNIPDLNNFTVTLSEVLMKLSGQNFVLTTYPDFTKMFTFRAIVDYTGIITEIGARKYIARLAYPPRPVLSEYTVTEKQLVDWTKNENTGGYYLPPSIYIPIAST